MGKRLVQQRENGRNVNTRKEKQAGNYVKEPKGKWVDDRLERSKQVHIQPKNQHQQDFLDSLKANTITIGSGSAGTGKSMLSCYFAANQLLAGEIRKIVITRPYVAVSGRTTGFKPNTDIEKLRGFVLPMLGYLSDILGSNAVEQHIKNFDKVELAPLESIRGRNFDDAIIIVDEAQNCTIDEIKAISTRLGRNCSLILIGDNTQSDMQYTKNGLAWFERLVKVHKVSSTGVVKFNRDDIVRSGMVKELIIAFENDEESQKPKD